MSDALTLARPYARAAFEVAAGDNAVESWSEALRLAGQVASDPRVHALLNDPRVDDAQLVAMHLPEGAPADGPFARFLGEVARYRRLGLLPEIGAVFEARRRQAQSILKVNVTSAMALDDDETAKLKASLQRRFGQDIEMDVAIDADLLGGIVIDTGTEVIDDSVRGRLDRLASALTH